MLEILAFVLLLVVIQRIKVIRGQYRCVSDQSLRSHLYGRLKKNAPGEYERLIAHLGLCEKCRDRLMAISNGEDYDSDLDIEEHLIEP